MKSILTITLLLLFSGIAPAATINVPSDQPTIQAGIDAASDADTVLVQPGTYVENINFDGKNIVVGSLFITSQDTTYISQTVIDGNQSGSVVTFENRENSTAVLSGFMIINGLTGSGGGISCSRSSPSLIYLTISNNTAERHGGGIYFYQSNSHIKNVTISGNLANLGGGIYYVVSSYPSLENVTITGNTANSDGGGIHCYNQSHPSMVNVTISRNTTEGDGGGIYFYQSNSRLKNVTINGNSASRNGGGIDCYMSSPLLEKVNIHQNTAGNSGGGICCGYLTKLSLVNVTVSANSADYTGGGIMFDSSEITLVNSISWNNSPQEIYSFYLVDIIDLSSISIAYSNIQGGKQGIATNDSVTVNWLEGNIDVDPLFVDVENSDFNLQQGSPCIDAGTAFFVSDGDTLINVSQKNYSGSAPDMGAFGIFEYVPLSEFALYKNYPDPFNLLTTIEFSLPETGLAELIIYDSENQKVRTLVSKEMAVGVHSVAWDARDDSGERVPPGTYIATLTMGIKEDTSELTVISGSSVPVLNEVMSSNQATIEDEDGDYPDWIEIYNPGDFQIYLTGYGLSDRPLDPFKWVFPSVILNYGEHLLIFASGKDRLVGSFFHTSFRISADGETLVLTDSSNTLCDSISTGEMSADISRGRKPDGGVDWVLFEEPTPGTSNTTQGYGGVTDTVVEMSLPGGFYPSSISVVLSCDSPTADIRYTIDGSAPTDSSSLYSTSIAIDTTMVVRSCAIETGMIPVNISTNTYFIGESSTLPVVSLSTAPANLFDDEIGIYVEGNKEGFLEQNYYQEWERPAHIEFYEPDGNLGFSIDSGIKIQGYTGLNKTPKRSLGIYARGSYGYPEIENQIFPNSPVTEFTSFVLRNSGDDWNTPLFRDALMHSLLSDLDLDILGYRPCNLFINGVYWGIYNIRERLNEEYLVSHHSIDPNNIDILEFDGGRGGLLVVEGDSNYYTTMIEYIKNNDMNNPTSYDYINTQMDIDNFIDYIIAEVYVGNYDWPGFNVKFWRTRSLNGKWRWMLFDTDCGFGFPYFEDTNYEYNMLEHATFVGLSEYNILLRKLLINERFRDDFINRFADHLNTIFIPQKVLQKINEMKAILEPEMLKNIERWKDFSEFNPMQEIDEWHNNIQVLEEFAKKRPHYQRSHIMQKFSLSDTVTVELTVSPPDAGKIKISTLTLEDYPWEGTYFTDVPIQLSALPNLGYKFIGWTGVSPEDSSSVTVTLTDDISVTAVFEEEWNALNTIVINEINYNSSIDFNPGDWVELYNAYNIPIDISGWIFKDSNYANRFEIPENTIIAANDYLVLCNNDSLFSEAFPEVDNYIGNLGFNLSNAGELIRLINDQGDIVDSLTYDDNDPWPEEPDGTGATLALLNPARDNAFHFNWVSSLNHGTPGEINDVFTSVDETTQLDVPTVFSLRQNYPNPFNPTTVIEFSIPETGHINLTIYNIMGQKVRELVSDNFRAGTHTIIWDGKDDSGNTVSSGIYISKLVSGKHEATGRMLLIK